MEGIVSKWGEVSAFGPKTTWRRSLEWIPPGLRLDEINIDPTRARA
jgi:hypothetical protein